MNSLNDILSQWLGQILETVKIKQGNKQRHKKMVRLDGVNQKFRQLTDITSTGNQHRYPNSNVESVVTSIIGENGNDASRYCISNSVRRDLMTQKRIDHLFVDRNGLKTEKQKHQFDEMAMAFRGSIKSEANCKAFAQKAANEWLPFQNIYGADTAATEDDIFDFARKVYIPQYLYNFINPKKGVWKIIEKVQDADLYTDLLNQTDQTPAAEQAIRQFLSNRLATNSVDLAVDLQVELQNLFPDIQLDTIGNSDKCALSLFYNIKRALGQIQSAPTSQPQDTKKIKLLKGINRDLAALQNNPVYSALVRTERAKVAASHAVRMYTAGLALMKKPKYADRGLALIYNYDDKKGEFRNTSAASAVLLMYIELMDYFINPSPPLMLRSKMKNGLCLRKFDDTVDISGAWQTWTEEHKRAYRAQHDEYLREFMNVGFSVDGQHEVTGLPTLNIDDWGQEETVPNPFRVREDTFLYKYFGPLRLQPNRLGIGNHARDIWINHTIKKNYDPDYQKEFYKREATEVKFYPPGSDIPAVSAEYPIDLPRPIYDNNFCGKGNTQPLYAQVCIELLEGPVNATKTRKRMDDEDIMEDTGVLMYYSKIDNGECTEKIEDEPVYFSRMARAALDIHQHLCEDFKVPPGGDDPCRLSSPVKFPDEHLGNFEPGGEIKEDDGESIINIHQYYEKNVRFDDTEILIHPLMSEGQWDLRVSLSALLKSSDMISEDSKVEGLDIILPPAALILELSDDCIAHKKTKTKQKRKKKPKKHPKPEMTPEEPTPKPKKRKRRIADDEEEEASDSPIPDSEITPTTGTTATSLTTTSTATGTTTSTGTTTTTTATSTATGTTTITGTTTTTTATSTATGTTSGTGTTTTTTATSTATGTTSGTGTTSTTTATSTATVTTTSMGTTTTATSTTFIGQVFVQEGKIDYFNPVFSQEDKQILQEWIKKPAHDHFSDDDKIAAREGREDGKYTEYNPITAMFQRFNVDTAIHEQIGTKPYIFINELRRERTEKSLWSVDIIDAPPAVPVLVASINRKQKKDSVLTLSGKLAEKIMQLPLSTTENYTFLSLANYSIGGNSTREEKKYNADDQVIAALSQFNIEKTKNMDAILLSENKFEVRRKVGHIRVMAEGKFDIVIDMEDFTRCKAIKGNGREIYICFIHFPRVIMHPVTCDIKESGIGEQAGKGAFANVDVEPHQFIGEYKGVLSFAKDAELKHSDYMTNGDWMISDADPALAPGLDETKFFAHRMNHQWAANVAVAAFNDRWFVHTLFDRIKAKQELFYNYGERYWFDKIAKDRTWTANNISEEMKRWVDEIRQIITRQKSFDDLSPKQEKIWSLRLRQLVPDIMENKQWIQRYTELKNIPKGLSPSEQNFKKELPNIADWQRWTPTKVKEKITEFIQKESAMLQGLPD